MPKEEQELTARENAAVEIFNTMRGAAERWEAEVGGHAFFDLVTSEGAKVSMTTANYKHEITACDGCEEERPDILQTTCPFCGDHI